MDMCVDTDVLRALEREDEHQIRGFPADARQRQQLLHRLGDAAVETFDEQPACLLHMSGLVPVEADGIDQLFDQHLKRIFLARFGDLLDGWKFEAVDFARERAHDGWYVTGSRPTRNHH